MSPAGWHPTVLALGFCAVTGLGAGAALGQSVERNLPPVAQPEAPAIAAPALPPAERDNTALGATLRAIILLGATEAVQSGPVADGVAVPAGTRIGDALLRRRLAPYLGQPLSRALIARIEAAVVGAYRARGFPFLSVSTPEQEIDGGVLQVRIVEFHLERIAVTGVTGHHARYVESRVRAKPGDPIDARALGQDLDWLNRYPYRRTEALFSPGTTLGGTVMGLQATRSRPWSAYAGFVNSGSPLTGTGRYFAGVEAGLALLNDAVISYQFTGSQSALFGPVRDDVARYASHAARLLLPTAPRQGVEVSLSVIRSTQPVQDFTVRQGIEEASIGYRGALSGVARSLPGEAVIGVELKRARARTYFAGEAVTDTSIDLFQLTAGYALQASDRLGRTSGSLLLHYSPGGIDGRNSGAALDSFSRGRVTSARYAYVGATLDRSTRLGARGWSLSTSLAGQYAAVPLPLTEQIGLGNNSLVRGYTLDDGAFDAGVVLRNELRAPPLALLGHVLHRTDQLSPYVLVDAGYGRDQALGRSAEPVSVGAGLDYVLPRHLALALDGACAVRDVGRTRAGAVRLEARVSVAL